jgi:hypothetical protein
VTTRGRRTLLVVAAAAVIASGALGVGIAEAVGGTGHPAASGYGGLPSFLPRSSLRPDSTLTGTLARPALTSEGDAVRARLAHGSVRITVSGPVVPGEGLPYQATADTATWTVTMSHASGTVPVSMKAFSTVDLLGATYHPRLVPGQPRPPATLRPGHEVRFELRVVMPVGEGMMRWAPVRHGLLATWDFVVEND